MSQVPALPEGSVPSLPEPQKVEGVVAEDLG